MTKVTNHSKERVKERCGLSKNSTEKLAEKAYTDGITHSEAKGHLHKYITKLFLAHKNGNNIRIYNRFVFIFKNDVLITVFPLPSDLHKLEDKLKERKKQQQENIQEL